MRLPIPFIGEHGIARSGHQSYQKCQNLYIETNKAGKYPAVLYRIPGLTVAVPDLTEPLRSNGALFDGKIFFVAGDSLYSIDQNDVVTTISSAIATSSGRVSIIEGQTYLMFVDGDDGYTYDGTTFGAIADANFPANQNPKLNPKHVTYKDGFFIVACSNDANYYVSDLEDPTAWDALKFANAEGRPDLLKNVHASDDFLYLFGEYSTEAWYNAGIANVPFARAQGGVSSWGVQAEWSVTEAGDSIFFLGRKRGGGREVCRTVGAQVNVVSTPEISDEINGLSQTDDAFGFSYVQNGHEYYVLTFPVGEKTFVYDLKEQLWHTRHTKDLGRWRPNGHGYYNEKHYVGNPADGQMYTLDLDTYADGTDYMTCTRTTPPIHKDYREIIFHELVLDLQGGVGSLTKDPEIMLRYSDDGGNTWSDELWVTVGKVGKYDYKARWNLLGASYERIFEFRTTDSFFTAWLGAYADVTVTDD